MAGGEEDEARTVGKPLFSPFSETPSDQNSYVDKERMPTEPGPGAGIGRSQTYLEDEHNGDGAYQRAPLPPPPPAPHHQHHHHHHHLQHPPPLLPLSSHALAPLEEDACPQRSDPPASTVDEPVNLPPAAAAAESEDAANSGDTEDYTEHMSEALAKVGQEELAKSTSMTSAPSSNQGTKPLSLTENLSTDPNLPVFMKRKRGRPRKHPLPEQPLPQTGGRKVGRPPRSNSRVITRKIKKEPVEEPLLVEQLLEDELAEHLPTEQSLAVEEDRNENAIRFTDVGNHLPLLVTGQHLCAVCLSRHSHRQSAGVRRTRSTSFKRFTSVICRACNKFLCVAPRADGRTCFDIYHTMKDFVRADLPEFNRKECGDGDVLSNDFDDSPDLTEDANMLLKLLQVASGEINKMSDLDYEEQRDDLESSSEAPPPSDRQAQQEMMSVVTSLQEPGDPNTTDGNLCTQGQVKAGSPHFGRDADERLTGEVSGFESRETSATAAMKPEVKEGQSQAITLLLKVLKNHRVLSVSDTLQLRLERRPRKYNMTNRMNNSLSSVGGSPEELTRKYRRKGRPRKHISTDDEGDKPEEAAICGSSGGGGGADDSLSLDGDSGTHPFTDLITPGTRRKYACGRCHAEFNLIARMKVHLKAHVERKTYSCTVCEASFRTKGKLAEHRKMHKTERNHQCPKCDESFKKMILLRRHMRTHQDIKPYQCRICGSRFSYASSLKEHALNKHLGERPFKCTECVQGFTRQINLLEHMRMHTGERPFKCPKCDQSFARKSGLKSHMISHTGEKKHICSICGARFRHKIALTEHQRTHTGEKPFVCSHCGQRFAASTTLRNHVRLHTGEKPHKCKTCGAGFAQRTSLNCHMKKHGVVPAQNKSPRNNWTKNFKQAQTQGMTQDMPHPGSTGQMPLDQGQGPPPPNPQSVHHQEHTPQPHDYSDKSHLQGHAGHGDNMMAQAVSMAFNKMVPEMLQGGMPLPRRPDSGPPPVVSTSQPHTMSHHQVAPAAHHSIAPSPHRVPHEPLQPGIHVAAQAPQSHGRASVHHNDVHELERPSSHSNHGGELKSPSSMPLTSTTLHWSQEPSNIPTFPFDPTFHPQMSQGFPGMLPSQPPNHSHSYPEQPRFPFDNRFGMDAWPAHSNWKHKYQ